MGEKKASGRKVAYMVIGSVLVASIVAVVMITVFYATYDPTKYGRNNGGIDTNNTGVPAIEQVDE